MSMKKGFGLTGRRWSLRSIISVFFDIMIFLSKRSASELVWVFWVVKICDPDNRRFVSETDFNTVHYDGRESKELLKAPFSSNKNLGMLKWESWDWALFCFGWLLSRMIFTYDFTYTYFTSFSVNFLKFASSLKALDLFEIWFLSQ